MEFWKSFWGWKEEGYSGKSWSFCDISFGVDMGFVVSAVYPLDNALFRSNADDNETLKVGRISDVTVQLIS